MGCMGKFIKIKNAEEQQILDSLRRQPAKRMNASATKH